MSADPPEPTRLRAVRMYAAERLLVVATAWSDGSVCIEGQDLGPNTPGGDEYEYYLTVAAGDVPRLVAALGGAVGDDALSLLAVHGQAIVEGGETRWLGEHGVPFGVHTW